MVPAEDESGAASAFERSAGASDNPRSRIYISAPTAGASRSLRLPAGELEGIVRQALADLLNDRSKLLQDLQVCGGSVDPLTSKHLSGFESAVPGMATSEMRRLLTDLDVRIEVHGDRLSGSYLPGNLLENDGTSTSDQRCEFAVPGVLTSRGHEARLVILRQEGGRRRPNARLMSLLIRSFAARRALIEDAPPADKATANARKSYLSRIARVSYLAPDIVQAIVEGTQPAGLGAREVLRAGELPLCWSEQRRMFGLPETES